MRTYGQGFCPIARASELIAERWTPIIVRNLLLGCSTFGELLEGAPGIPRSLLSRRLRDLERAGVVRRTSAAGARGHRYELTPAGTELEAVCEALGRWGARWLDGAPANLDPGTLLWAVAKCMDEAALPSERVVVRFDLDAGERFWLLVQRPEPELCRKHPGLDEDLLVASDTDTIAAWHMGRLSLAEARRGGRLTITGLPRLVRAFGTWGGQTPFVDAD